MTREIKFRAWDNGKKEWLFGYELPNLGGFSLFGEIMLLDEWARTLDRYIFERNGYKQEDLVVMQYTGLLDKSGKEIYEGDIVRGKNSGFPNHNASVNVIEWGYDICEEYLCVGWKGINCGGYSTVPSASEVEVIGNIYENPELLK